MSKTLWRYVELTYLPPGSQPPNWRWYAVICEADSPDAAFAEARRKLHEDLPHAGDVDEFLHRTISAAKADQIREAMAHGTWEGWAFSGEPVG